MTSRRVLICSETTPAARKPAQARPAPRPKRRVRVEAIQSVESGVEVVAGGLGLGLGGGVTWALLRVGVVGGLGVIVGGGCMDWVCDGGGVGVGGVGEEEEEEAERWSLVSGWERREGEPMAAMSTTVSVLPELHPNGFLSRYYPHYIFQDFSMEIKNKNKSESKNHFLPQ